MTIADILKEQVLGIFTQKSQILEIEGVVDIFTDETHSLRVAKTAQPIETGSSITDNSVVEPQTLRMSGYVSNLVLAVGSSVPASERGKEAWVQLEELAKRREPVTILTTLKMYENFLIVALEAESNERTGTALEFTIDFEEILFADSAFATLSAKAVTKGPAKGKEGTVNGGTIQPKDPTPAQRESWLRQLRLGLGGLIERFL